MIVDIWSRKIIAAQVFAEESMDHSAMLSAHACMTHGVQPEELVLHSDNGGPLKGATMLVTLHRLGVIPSFSRPSVSNDNPYSESLFRTMKYRPEYPSKPFENIEQAQSWVDGFVFWYNTQHLHSSIRYVTPDDRHFGREEHILANRRKVYEKAQSRNPNRWSKNIRNWNPVSMVRLNPEKKDGPITGFSMWESREKFTDFMKSEHMEKIMKTGLADKVKNWTTEIKASLFTIEQAWHVASHD